MMTFSATILKFDKHGEKTGWTCIEVPFDITCKIKPNSKKSFKVKGKLDSFSISQISLLPMGEGNFILPLNAAIRKAIAKSRGATIKVQLTEDKKEYELNKELMECLADEPAALKFFQSKSKFYQTYYSKWIETAKTDVTKAKRIAMAISALAKKIEFGDMLKMERDKNAFLKK